MNTVTTKAVRIMAEHFSNGLWRVGLLPPESLHGFRISSGLYARLQRWVNQYEELDKAEGYTGEHVLPGWTTFNAEGYAIAFAVKAELPDWHVVYVDETLLALPFRTLANIEIPSKLN
jgi:hypothetical protein